MPPDTAPDDAKIEEHISTLLAALPKTVRDFMTGKEFGAVVSLLSKKYQLHADQAGQFHQALIFLMLGVYSPDRFVNKLEDEKFPEETVEGILADLNERVFAPLRKAQRTAEQKASAAAPAARKPLANVPAPLGAPGAAPVPPAAPRPAPPAPAPVVVPAAPAVSVAPAAPMPSPAPVMPAEPLMRTMAHDVEAMNGPRPAPQTPAAPSAPAVSVAPAAPAPVSETPSAWAAPVAAPRSETPPPHPTRAIGAPDPQEVTDTLKKYGIDPYREPVE